MSSKDIRVIFKLHRKVWYAWCLSTFPGVELKINRVAINTAGSYQNPLYLKKSIFSTLSGDVVQMFYF
ncbi:MAG TPA: hypothetical protein PLX42_08475 [Tenuifilaceae bacterium]|jgi:hypothetical protein|nr:hypothetical protein [Tenuifilaceae bacterium]